jgi:peptidoglycan pentaglycine glycine transferase (the first glycine)
VYFVEQVLEDRREYWDREVSGFACAHPLNAFGWGKVRSVDGWAPSYFLAKNGEKTSAAAMVLIKRLPAIGKAFMYAPRGPLWDPADEGALAALLERIREEAQRNGAVFLRIDPNIVDNPPGKDGDALLQQGFVHLDHRWTFWNTPRDVYRIDLTNSANEEELFKTLDRDARRCVRKAKKEGVSIRPTESRDELERFYHIFKEFSIGRGFMSRGFEYQKSLWDEFVQRGRGRLFLAVYEGEIIGGLICILFAGKCLAMHMGTPYRYQRLQTYYAYVWESIKWAWEERCVWYSFRGVGTTPSQEFFKRKFGPEVVALVGYYDLPFRPLYYRLFYKVEFDLLPRTWKAFIKARRVSHKIVSLGFHRNAGPRVSG